MIKTTYVVWRAKDQLKFRVGQKVFSTTWNLQRERELQELLARWQEHAEMAVLSDV